MKEYKSFDWLRVLSCLAILLYHLNIIPRGYLAVCTFFVLSGYLSVRSSMKKENFSLFHYYKDRAFKIYIPMLVVTFLTIAIISFFPIINWLNLKPETTSVIFGYNNFWQLSVNLDYFARHLTSPFMHFWYMSILLQFDVIFPILFLSFKKLGEKIHRSVPCILSFCLAIISTIYFYFMSSKNSLMLVYYETWTRMFSLLLGFSLGFIHTYFGVLIPQKLRKKPIVYTMLMTYGFIFILLFFFDIPYFSMSTLMILVTLMTCRFLDYGTIFENEKTNIFHQGIKFLSKISFEIYLVQYPVLFLFQYINMEESLKFVIIFLLIIGISYFLFISLNWKSKRGYILKIFLCILIIPLTLYGSYLYIIAKDYTEEMKALEKDLIQNEKIIEENQSKYMENLKKEQNDWLSVLNSREDGEKQLAEIVKNLPIVGIGDSVMLGAVNRLYETFPNSYFDASISRTAWVANGILKDLIANDQLGNPVILNLGINGDCSEECKIEILETLKEKDIYWINITDNMNITSHFNEKLENLSQKYSNLHIIDWNQASKNHPEYFIADKIHLTSLGMDAYTKTIYDTIYKDFLTNYQEKTKDMIKKHEEEQKKKITFLGNDLLLNAYAELEQSFPDAKFILKKDVTYEKIYTELKTMRDNDSLNYNVVLAMDASLKLTEEQYQEIISLCKNHKLYLFSTENLVNFTSQEVVTKNIETEIEKENFMADRIHLNKSGNQKLIALLKEVLQFK